MNEVELERLVTRLVGDGSSYERMMTQAATSANRTAGIVSASSSRIQAISATMTGWGRTAIGVLSSFGVALGGLGLLRSSVTLAAETEQMELSFGVMLRSAERGKQMMKDLIQFAAETPLELPGILQATRLLLNYGIAGDSVIPVLRRIGDIAGGENDRFQRLALVYGQVRTAGRLLGQDLRQMQEAGFNPLEEMARTTGRSVSQLTEEMHHGRVSFQMVADAMRSATSEGGRFHNLMEQQSRTTSGLFSTLRDNVRNALRTIGKDIIEQLDLKTWIRRLSDVANSVGDWLDAIPAAVKRVGAALLVATATTLLFGLAWAGVSYIVNASLGGFPAMLGLLVTAGIAVVAWAASFPQVRQAASDTWDWITARVNEFLVWAQPTTTQLANLFVSTWGTIQETARQSWEVIKVMAADVAQAIGRGFQVIFGEVGGLDWETLQQHVVGMLIALEFAITHTEDIASIFWTNLKLSLLSFANDFAYFFTDTLPPLFRWFLDNWKNMFTTAWNFVISTNLNGLTNMANIIRNLPGLLAGTTSFADVWRPLTEGFQSTLTELPTIARRGMSETEQALSAGLKQQQMALGADYQRFFAERVKQAYFPRKAIGGVAQEAARAGEEVGQSFADKAIKEIHKFDAALVGSAEAFARIQEFQDRMAGNDPNRPRGGGNNENRRFDAAAVGSAEANARVESRDILTQIRDALLAANNRARVELAAANLGGES
jgi:tape measure domain-containing protein